MIIGCMNIANECDTIRMAIDAVHPFLDRLVIIDGFYETFPYHGENGASDDGTLEILDGILEDSKVLQDKTTIIEANGLWLDEMTKKSEFFKYGGAEDWFFIVDGDELLLHGGNWLQNDLKRMEGYDAFSVLFLNPICITKTAHEVISSGVRLYKWKRGLQYYQQHALIINEETGVRYKIGNSPIVFKNIGYMRSPKREAKRIEFYASGKCV